jgi:probable HAF family extracellular repeat protein
MVDLGSLGGTFSYANGINSSGQIVATSQPPGWYSEAFLYTPGSGWAPLGDLGYYNAWAFGINESGQAVGYSWAGSGYHGVLYNPGASIADLNSLISPLLDYTIELGAATLERRPTNVKSDI